MVKALDALLAQMFHEIFGGEAENARYRWKVARSRSREVPARVRGAVSSPSEIYRVQKCLHSVVQGLQELREVQRIIVEFDKGATINERLIRRLGDVEQSAEDVRVAS